MDFDPDDVSSNPSNNTPFKKVVAARLSRRDVLRGGVAAAATGFFTIAADPLAQAVAAPGGSKGRPGSLLGFRPVATSDADTLTVPDGYVAEILIPWGTPILSTGPAWRKDASNTAAEQAQQIGMHHDGMHFFPLGKGPKGSRRGLLVLNHEYVDRTLLYSDGDEVMTQEKVDKALAAHGVSVMEIALVDNRWQPVDSPFNRRVTGTTPVTFSGPVRADHPALQSNNAPMGTLNNCSMGVTP